MAFPVRASEAFSSATGGTSRSFAMPSGVAAGDILLTWVVIQTDQSSTFSGWTKLFSSRPNVARFELWWRLADGSEGATQTFNIGVGTGVNALVARFTGATGTPEVNFGAGFGSYNPPSLSPSWGAEDTLWLASLQIQGTGTTITSYPTGFTNQTFYGANNQIGLCELSLNAASQDPSAFSVGSARNTAHATIALRPSPASAAKAMSIIAQQQALLSGGVL